MINKASLTNSVNALIHYHAGVIKSSIGKKNEAVKSFQLALNNNLASHLLFYKDANERLNQIKNLVSLN
jgi:hypothetical protein